MNNTIMQYKHSKQYAQYPRNYQLKLPLELDVFIPTDAVVRLLSQLLEELDYTYLFQAYSTQGRKFKISPVILFKLIVFGYLENHYSSRSIADACQRDLHFIWLLEGNEPPSHQLINSFRKDRLTTNILENLFYQLIEKLIEAKEIELKNLFIDGTKLEANANRYTFTWKKSIQKQEEKLLEKTRILFIKFEKELNLICAFSETDVLGSLQLVIYLMNKEIETSGIMFVSGKGKRKSSFQKLYEQAYELYQRQCRYTEANEIFNGRNSYSKTDHDATFMHLKDDHMNNGQLKPAYNVQVGVESEYIVSIQHFPNPTDVNTLIPFLNHLFEKLGRRYPHIVADAGYESEENYTYLEANDQISYIKPLNYEQSKKKNYKLAIGKRENMIYNEVEDFYICANQQKLVKTGTHIKENKKTKFKAEITTYQCQSCEKCPLRQKCTTAKDGKKIQVPKNFIKQREASLENIQNDLGVCLRVNRSIQAEGTFGILKEDHHFTRFLTRGNEQVLTELLLLGISFNIRKLHVRIQNERSDKHLFKDQAA